MLQTCATLDDQRALKGMRMSAVIFFVLKIVYKTIIFGNDEMLSA